ncbi:hypothetical protein PoB_000682200 [Plakobranchus ocellatus]|uniref:Uncharacterized protein n=1 Tax=Plakobranchus ocellatus TaxID=259542 RepID=A0AAV3YDX5_9GAST|nr:hypothetical protein PoB_000682200 [Plakobranchus ocellatus]
MDNSGQWPSKGRFARHVDSNETRLSDILVFPELIPVSAPPVSLDPPRTVSSYLPLPAPATFSPGAPSGQARLGQSRPHTAEIITLLVWIIIIFMRPAHTTNHILARTEAPQQQEVRVVSPCARLLLVCWSSAWSFAACRSATECRSYSY